jgi:hypothetical protein
LERESWFKIGMITEASALSLTGDIAAGFEASRGLSAFWGIAMATIETP